MGENTRYFIWDGRLSDKAYSSTRDSVRLGGRDYYEVTLEELQRLRLKKLTSRTLTSPDSDTSIVLYA